MRATLIICVQLFLLLAPARAADVEKGRYLAILGDCAGCHTAANGPALAGGLPFRAPFGTIYSTNITPDPDTGIGRWSAQDFYRALHDGIAPGGRHLYPAFPYAYFTRISRTETEDLFAYLKTVKPVRRAPTPNRLIFPFNLRIGLMAWNWLYLDRTPPAIPAGASAQWTRGEYLVNGLGHCAACHTPKDLLFGDIKSRALTGAEIDNWYSSDLTGNRQDGLGHWSAAEIAHYLATGRNRFATAAGTMQEKVSLSTSHMRDADRAAIAGYLKSLAPSPAQDIAPPSPAQMPAGQAVFVSRCQVCHGPQIPAAPGALPAYPRLAGDTLVVARNPATVLHIILDGAVSPLTPNEATGFSMPSFAALSDEEIADVATYIRNSGGNRAPAVTARQVKRLRAALAP